MANAKRINADLIRGDFAQENEARLKQQLAELSADLTTSQASQTQLKAQVDQSDTALTAERHKRQLLQLEVWGWRVLGLLTLIHIVR